MQKNKEFFEYNKVNVEKISSICAPLIQNFPIKTFGYRKFFNDGKYLALSNHLGWQEYYFSKINNPNKSFGKAIQEACPQNFTYFLWTQYPHEPIFHALYEYNIWRGLSIYRKKDEYVECFAFATTRDNPSSIDFYNHNNLKILKNFIEYFKIGGHDIIHNCPRRAFGAFNNFKIDPLISDISVYEKKLLDNFHRCKIIFTKDKKETILTKQEHKCLCFIVMGNTVKETANKLLLSQRTVEAYLRNILIKLDIKKKSELIKIFMKTSIYIRYIIKKTYF